MQENKFDAAQDSSFTSDNVIVIIVLNHMWLRVILLYSGLPMTHSLRISDELEPILSPFKSVMCGDLTL